jgi:L-ascorbate metabolism protein UlaG (beta-lactamase superfamily)
MITITKFEQSGFLLHSSEANETFGFDFGIYSKEAITLLPPLKALFISHVHSDHYAAENVAAIQTEIIFAAAEVQEDLQRLGIGAIKLVDHDQIGYGAIEINAFEVNHGPISKPISNLGFSMQIEEKRFLFCGDMKIAAQVPDIQFDLVLVPVGGGAVIFDAAEAIAFVSSLNKPGTIIPIHYQGKADPESGATFARLAGDDFHVKVLAVTEQFQLL